MTTKHIVPLLLFVVLSSCYGDDVFSHLILLDDLPNVFDTNSTREIIIRTNYSGETEFHEAESFKVLLNITAPSIQDAYAVNSQLVETDGNVLLQVFQKPRPEASIPLKWIFMAVGSFGGLVMLLTIIFSVWWYTMNKDDLIYNGRGYRGDASIYRSRSLGPVTGDLLGDLDDVFDSPDGGDADDRDRRKLEKLRVSLKPETIIEESEESADDDRTDLKRSHVSYKQWSLKLTENPLANENLSRSGFLDYPDQSGDEEDNDVSPEQRIADADGSYTPLDELDDFLQEKSNDTDQLKNANSITKLPDPRGNLDVNIHQSKSDGDLLDDRNKKMSERNKSITPLTINPPEQTKTKNIEVPKRRAEPNIYQRINLKSKENDLNGNNQGRDRTRVQVHSPEKFNNSTGQYVALHLPPDQRSRSRGSRESNDAYELYTYPAEIPLSTFKGPESVPRRESPAQYVPKVKPKPMYNSGSPTGLEYQNLNAHFKLIEQKDPMSPGSPGNFSMLSEGSSGEYDDNEHEHILELDDSDLEMSPPMHDGDMLSNASLPMPSPPPIANIGGYGVTPSISQLSPRHSLIGAEENVKGYGTVIALTGSPSPGGPYSKHSVAPGPDGSRFVFPPPPTMYSPSHENWTRRELFRDEGAGEYVGLDAPGMYRGEEKSEDQRQRERRRSGERDRRQSGERDRRQSGEKDRRQSGERRMSGGKKGRPPKLHIAIISSMCILGVLSGVYCLTPSDTSVKIVVYAPPHISFKNATLYTSLHKNVDVIQDKKGSRGTDKIKWFVSENPILESLSSTLCKNHYCPHGCDENTGNCICRHGFKMNNNICEDVNECQTVGAKCSNKKAGCENTEGSYECLCIGKDLYENFEGECRACWEPCTPGTYQDQPCDGEQKKTCRECTKACLDNEYMKASCSAKDDISCETCHTRCDTSETMYEYSQCSATQNRECEDRDILPSPVVSDNVVLEDLMVGEDDIEYFEVGFEGRPSFSLRRGNRRGIKVKGSDFWIDADIKYFNPSALFHSVNHSSDMDREDYPGSPQVMEKYCQYPVPSYYELIYSVHQNVSYKGDPMEDPDSLEPCQGVQSNFPDMRKTRKRSIICSEPGPLNTVFKMNASDFRQTATEWLERSERCRREHEACENCSGLCGIEMIKDSDQCSVNVNDDNGRSPRLPLCFTCCVRRKCSEVCKLYHDDRCRVERCQNGNLVQFQLRPVYSRLDEYYCHIEQQPDQLLLQIDYTVSLTFHQRRNLLFSRNMSVYSDKGWRQSGRVYKSDGLLDVEIDSELREIPNFIQRALGARDIKVGVYEPTGIPIESTKVDERQVNIRPLTPFGINPKLFGSRKCDAEVVKDTVIATVNDGLYRPLNKELVSIFMDNGSYLITNRSSEANVKFKLLKTTSILKAFYPPSKLKLNTLAGNLTYNKTHWVVMVEGELDTCPGFFSLNLSDPHYSNSTLYQFAVGVSCPDKRFLITFSVPTGDSALVSKSFKVDVKDDKSRHSLMIFAPAKEIQTYKKVSTISKMNEESNYDQAHNTVEKTSPPAFSTLYIAVISVSTISKLHEESKYDLAHNTVEKTSPPAISTLYIAVVSGVILVLLLLLIFGVAWRQGVPEGVYQMFRSHHLAVLVLYITFQFVYAVVVSITLFVVIVIAVNGETTSFLKQYKLQRSVTTALSQLELDQMELHVRAELLRLNSVSTQSKSSCKDNILTVMEEINKVAKTIQEDVTNKIRKDDIKELILNHTQFVIRQFSRDLIKFRAKYDKYEKFLLHKLVTEVESTYNSVQKSEWLLRGARFIHSFVMNIRTFHSGAATMPFMEWANLETNITELAKGLSLPLPDLPVLRFNPVKSSLYIDRFVHHTPTAAETRNQWFIQPGLVPEYNKTDNFQREEKPTLDSGSFMIFIIFMVGIDILMFLHRVIKAIGTGKLLLYGYPIYVDARDQKIVSTPDEKKPLNNKKGRRMLKNIVNKLFSTYFIPKLIGTTCVGLLVIFILIVSNKFINKETFKYLGYYNNIEDLMRINQNVMNSRLRTWAEHINTIEYPMFEQVMNVHIQRHQHVLSLLESQWRAVEESNKKTYCSYLHRINVSAECSIDLKDASLLDVKVDGCLFPPITPNLYYKNRATSSKLAENQLGGFLNKEPSSWFSASLELDASWMASGSAYITSSVTPAINRATSSKLAENQLDGFLFSIQNLISDTCHVIIIYMTIIILKELTGTVLWIYIKRSGFVSLRIIYETDESPGSADTSTNK